MFKLTIKIEKEIQSLEFMNKIQSLPHQILASTSHYIVIKVPLPENIDFSSPT
jgi:hypothetical protein